MSFGVPSRRCWLIVHRCNRNDNLLQCSQVSPSHPQWRRTFTSTTHNRNVSRLSQFWIPTGGIETARDAQDDSHALLVRAGYLRQAHSGIFHMLPLGHRVQQKLERLIDKHMNTLGASEVSLSSISSEELWQRSGRFVGHGGELFAFKDRKEAKFLLAPTHEEEITSLVANTVQSYKDLPLRLYQISRKYRDEARPRQGLLRGREFTMKDLYTFDSSEQRARETYGQVQQAYRAFLDDLKLPYLVAKADSGAMGGSLSHEYHFVSPKGEDNVISCNSCGYTINDELATTTVQEPKPVDADLKLRSWIGISQNRRTLIVVWFPRSSQPESGIAVDNEVNLNVLRQLVPEVDLSIEDAMEIWDKTNPRQTIGTGLREGASVINIIDPRISGFTGVASSDNTTSADTLQSIAGTLAYGCPVLEKEPKLNDQLVQLTRTQPGDTCQHCHKGSVKIDRAIEIGHTFHLGTRYSKPLDAMIVTENNQRVPIEMGCHGIGVSRLVGAIASVMADAKGLNWPAIVAPFQVVLVPGKGNEEDAEVVGCDLCAKLGQDKDKEEGFDVAVDDRNKPMGWKLNDADLVGYPLIVVLGRAWKKDRKVEVQCRRLRIKEEVDESNLAGKLAGYLCQL